MHYWRPRGEGGSVGFWPGGGVLSACGPGGGGGGVPSGKEGRGGALYYMNGFTTAPGICPCVCEFSLTRLLIISRLFWRPLDPAPGDICPPLPPPPLATPLATVPFLVYFYYRTPSWSAVPITPNQCAYKL